MLSPIAFYSPIAIATEDEEKARKAKMSIIIERYKDRVSVLHKHKTWNNTHVYKYEGFWYHRGFWYQSNASFSIEAVMASQDGFQAQPTDVFLASHPKSGTTWLKALAFAIANRTKFNFGPNHPLRTICPHDCVPFIESEAFLNNPSYANGLMATHIPYTSLPKSIISCGCRIVYICRDPKDVLISSWHFMNKLIGNESTPIKLEDAFEYFSKGIITNGSFWDNVVGYRKASLERRGRPDTVLFLVYEEMKKDPKNEVKKLAKFIGHPFTKEEEAKRVVEEIIELCSFEKLSNASTNANDEREDTLSNEIFFRKGIVGDSVNHLTPEMIQILDRITRQKYEGLDIPI
uniref:flavonol 3-sulfotransferase-like n=1 Tax=Erigeron canadensis TaxID=72917 RepID=UPI001CB921FF|nr:flavonol 3-sulfotransferase-like [Erigeron canadensis]